MEIKLGKFIIALKRSPKWHKGKRWYFTLGLAIFRYTINIGYSSWIRPSRFKWTSEPIFLKPIWVRMLRCGRWRFVIMETLKK